LAAAPGKENGCINRLTDELTPMIRKFLVGLMGVSLFALSGCAGSGGAASSGSTTPPSEFLRTGADVAVVDFFDMYCHTCQTAASHVNKLHSLVQSRGLGSKIAFYAIGMNNTEMEANLYRTRFKVPFPVIADRDRAIASRYGSFKPPMLIVLRREGGKWREIHRTADPMVPPDRILDKIWP
jgi:hypothetical protein